MAQYALPISDVLTSGWTEQAGDGDAFDELDEGFGAGRGTGSGPDSRIVSGWRNTGSVGSGFSIRTQLASVTDPLDSTGHIFRSHSSKDLSGGRQVDLTIELFQGGTLKAEETFVDVTDAEITRTHTLTTGEADSITDYADLRIGTYGTQVGGGGPRDPLESAHEFECPDASPGGFAHSQGVIVG